MTLETLAEEYENSDYSSVSVYLETYCIYFQDLDHSPLKDNPEVQRATQIANFTSLDEEYDVKLIVNE